MMKSLIRLSVALLVFSSVFLAGLSVVPRAIGEVAAQVGDDGGPIAFGQIVSGTIDPLADADNWTFYGVSGKPVTIRLYPASGSSLDDYLELFAPDGTRETYIDTGDIANWALRSTGTYTIRVSAYNHGSIGQYTLSLGPPPGGQGTPIDFDQIVSGTIDPLADADNWTFYGVSGQPVTIRLYPASGSSLDDYLELFAPDGTRETYIDTGDIANWALRSTGVYIIRVSAYEHGSIGQYTLSLGPRSGVFGTPAPTATPTATPTPTPVPTATPTPISLLTPTPLPTPPMPPFINHVLLYTGWNNIAYLGQTQPVAQALASIQGRYTTVFHYVNADKSWQSYSPNLPPFASNLTNLEYGQAYWIYTTEDCTLLY